MATPRTASTQLVGRTTELARLDELIADALGGIGHAVLVEGEPGIGRTALLAAARDRAERAGLRVHADAAEEIEQAVPFAAISACLDLAPWSGAVPESVRQVGSSGPVLLILDDLQWADVASLRIIGELAVSRRPVLLITACRPVPKRAELALLRQELLEAGAEVLSLAPLRQDEAHELATRLLGRPPEPAVLRLADGAGGNPRYVTDLIEALPPNLGRIVLRRLDFLSGDDIALLQTASVLGSGHTAEEIAAVTGRTVADVTTRARSMIDTGILAEQQGKLTFRHELIRGALYEHLLAAVRAAMHLQAALALSTPVESVARHLMLGTPSGSPRVLEWLTRNVEQLLAPETAAELLRRAVRLAEPADPRLGVLRVHLAAALLHCGHVEEATVHARQALARMPEPALCGRIRWILAQALYATNRPDLAMTEIDQALDDPHLTPEEVVRFRSLGSAALLAQGKLAEAERMANRVLDASARIAEVGALEALGTLAAVYHLRWQTPQALELVEHALRIGTGTGAHLPRLHRLRGFCLLELERLDEAEQAMSTAREISERHHPSLLTECCLATAFVRFCDGRWDDALAEVRAALNLAHDGMFAPLHGMAAIIAGYRGELGAAAEHLAAAENDQQATPTTAFYAFLVQWGRGLLDRAQGHPDRALEGILNALNHGLVPIMRPTLARILPAMARMAILTGNRDVARARIAPIEAELAAGDPARLAVVAAHWRGLLDADPDVMVRAAPAYEKSPLILFRANYHEDLAAVLAGAGRHAEAREALTKAIEDYGTLEAVRAADIAAARLRALGVRAGVRGPRRRPRSGWESLTDTERRVAFLVAKGLSNPAIAERLFVSKRTVQTHVSSILTKLDVTSRYEVANAVGRATSMCR